MRQYTRRPIDDRRAELADLMADIAVRARQLATLRLRRKRLYDKLYQAVQRASVPLTQAQRAAHAARMKRYWDKRRRQCAAAKSADPYLGRRYDDVKIAA